jgi:hypothetical protein
MFSVPALRTVLMISRAAERSPLEARLKHSVMTTSIAWRLAVVCSVVVMLMMSPAPSEAW